MNRPSLALAVVVCVCAATARAQTPRVDSLDAYVRAQMAMRHIPGLSLAIVQDGHIVLARAYGVADLAARTPVTAATLFQAGSISKPVSALAALHFVEAGRLSLDENVNDELTTWKVPDNRFTATQKVTLRRLLSHNAGVNVHGFPGYDVDAPRPSLVQVLNGAPPANTPPIRVDTTPGAIWRYSGGGFTIMQQMLIDVTRKPYPQLLEKTVLGPIGMTSSTFEQPPDAAHAARTASAYEADRSAVHGRWHVYPEMAAAGLWTNPTDLARFIIEIQQTLAGKGHGVISQRMARQYLTDQIGPSGLGIMVSGKGKALQFSHNGRDEGFDADLVGMAETGQGAVVMINTNDDSGIMGNIVSYIARAYGWPGAGAAPVPAATRAVPIARADLARYAGYYEVAENQMVVLAPDSAGTGLVTLVDGFPGAVFLAMGGGRFGSTETPYVLNFQHDAAGNVIDFEDHMPGGRVLRRLPRVAPLPSSVGPGTDPDRRRTARVEAALAALKTGGNALARSSDVTTGAKADFKAGMGVQLAGSDALTYIGEENVAGRGIHRHGGDVARVVYYRLGGAGRTPYVLVYLTAAGLVTDIDLEAQ